LNSPLDSSGRSLGKWYISSINLITVCHLTNLKVVQECTTIFWRSYLIVWGFNWITTIGFAWLFNFGIISLAAEPKILWFS